MSLHGRSLSGVQTALLTLSPAFIASVRALSPKPRRRSKVPLVLAVAMIAIVAALGADRSTRDFLLARGTLLAAAWLHRAPAAAPPRIAEPTFVATPRVIRARVATGEPGTDAPASPASVSMEKSHRPTAARTAKR